MHDPLCTTYKLFISFEHTVSSSQYSRIGYPIQYWNRVLCDNELSLHGWCHDIDWPSWMGGEHAWNSSRRRRRRDYWRGNINPSCCSMTKHPFAMPHGVIIILFACFQTSTLPKSPNEQTTALYPKQNKITWKLSISSKKFHTKITIDIILSLLIYFVAYNMLKCINWSWCHDRAISPTPHTLLPFC